MTKVLSAATIIPPELYVHRDADRQLRRVLDEMGRPGYILVARQMGKTNLLLNARRELQGKDDVFLYVDLSNQFQSSRECFQNIIDTAIDTFSPRFENVKDRISAIRKLALPDHKEHEKELRELLACVPGKLVVILDEVDSLTATSFSDQIFAQIRSTYFSRVNIQEYARLTYVLSGVAEPSELIRNAKLSPFNIGEKIYLSDFRREEFDEFLTRAQLEVSQNVADRIFDWTGGNPRMTWDTCAAIEECVREGTLTEKTVDEVVRQLYLTSYDRAPVDHIRTLAEGSPEIRRALVEIRYSKGNAISDSVRTRLYLAGITSSNRSDVKIKSAIISQALSQEWLDSIERQKVGLRKMADDRYASGRYEEARALYEDYLATGTPSGDELVATIDGLFLVDYSSERYSDALAWLERARWDKTGYPELYFSQKLKEGLCYYRLERYADSIRCFEECASAPQGSRNRMQALLNLASALYKDNPAGNRDRVVEHYSQAIATAQGLSSASRDHASTEVAARYNLAIVMSDDNGAEAIAQLTAAMGVASSSERVVLLRELSKLVPQSNEKVELLRQCVDQIVESHVRPVRNPSATELQFTMGVFSSVLHETLEIGDEEMVNRICRYAMNPTVWERPGEASTVYDMLIPRMARKTPEQVQAYVGKIAKVAESLGAFEGLEFSTKLLAHYSRGKVGHSAHVDRFLELIPYRSLSRAFDRLDFSLIAPALLRCFDRGNVARLKSILDVVEPFRAVSERAIFVVFDYYAMSAARLEGDVSRSAAIARKLSEDVGSLSKDQTWITKADVEVIRQSAAAEVFQAAGPPPPVVRAGRKFQRNDRVRVQYADGRVITTKYKKIEEDIRNGLCVIKAVLPN